MDWAPTVAMAMVSALICGWLARRAGLSPIVGYLVAGVVIGPNTPGFMANAALAGQLADVGVVLLMFGVGLSFSFSDLWAVRGTVIPGALVASSVAVACGTALGVAIGWPAGAAMVLGMCLATASTVVIVRGLIELDMLSSLTGRIAVGWSVVEDLITVLLLVLLPVLAGQDAADSPPLLTALALTVGKVALMIGLVVFGGGLVVPKLLAIVSRVESKELFTLSVLTIALGVAYLSARVFDVSLALGAFFGGVVVGRSDLSHQAAADALPLRDAFAVLFFVAVGMLFDPTFVIQHPLWIVAALGVVLVAKPAAAMLVMLLKGYPPQAALSVGAGIAQVSEFSFVLAALAASLGIMPEIGRQVVVAAALLSITANPLVLRSVRPLGRLLTNRQNIARWLAKRSSGLAELDPGAVGGMNDLVLLCGFGRVGTVLGRLLQARGVPFRVIDLSRGVVERLRAEGMSALYGDAGSPVVLDRAGVRHALILLLTVPDPISRRLAIEHARLVNPAIQVLVRVGSEAQVEEMSRIPNTRPVHGEREAGFAMAKQMLELLGVSTVEAEATVMAAHRGVEPRQNQPRLFEIQVPAESAAVGKTLSELNLPMSTLIVAIVRQGHHIVARGPTQVEPGDALLLFARVEDAREVERIVTAPAAETTPAPEEA